MDAYAAATGLSEARVSKLFVGAGHRLKTIRAGGDIGARQAEIVLARISANWPPDAAWPDGVPRPAPITPSPAVNPPPPGAAAP